MLIGLAGFREHGGSCFNDQKQAKPLMLYAFCGILGFVAGLRLRWPGLVVLAALLSISIAAVGVAAGGQLIDIVVRMAVSVAVLNIGYAVPVLLSLIAACSPTIRHLAAKSDDSKMDQESVGEQRHP